jgi:toxin ParE1/3/4
VKGYELAPDARVDLDGIWKYIAQRSSAETATDFVWSFQEIFASIAQSPSVGVLVPGAPKAGTRKFPMGNYIIYYQPKRGGATILRVIHGRRQQFRALRHRPK